MSQADRDKWNTRYQQAAAPDQVSPFLLTIADQLPGHGTALEVAGGAGANALWLARRGLQVTLLDIAEQALQRAQTAAAREDLTLETLASDLDTDPLPPGPHNLITCLNFLDRRLFPTIPTRLRPGGLFVYLQPTRKNLERHCHPSARFLLEDGELPSLVTGLEILRYEEAWFDGRHEARLVARRPG